MPRHSSTPAVKRRRILFSLVNPQAREVSVAGEFNGWNPATHPMKSNGNGNWQKIMMLPPGQYEYKFLVDGQWRNDPSNPDRTPNCYGTYNDILKVNKKQA